MLIRNVILVLLLFFTIAYSQTVLNNAQVLYYNDQLDELQELLPALYKDFPEHPTVMFFKGVFELNALTALDYYENVFSRFPDSQFADDALFRVGQYYYSLSEFTQARKYFQSFIKRYPKSGLIDRVQYLFCHSYYGEGKIDSAHVFFKAFVKNVQSSPFVNLAILDLENEEMWKELKKTVPQTIQKPPAVSYKYSIQIGAFSVENNALRVKEKFQDDHYVEIRKKIVQNKVFYAVWIGRFNDRDDALKYAKKYLDQFQIDYKIINR